MANQFPLTAAEKASFNRVVTTPPTKPLGDVLEQLGGTFDNEGGTFSDEVTIYWDPQNGSDNNDGAAEATPLLTWTAVANRIPANFSQTVRVVLLSDLGPTPPGSFGAYGLSIQSRLSGQSGNDTVANQARVILEGKTTPETVVPASNTAGSNPTEHVITMEASVSTAYVPGKTFLRPKNNAAKDDVNNGFVVKAISGTDVTIITGLNNTNSLDGEELDLFVVDIEIDQGVVSLGPGCQIRNLISNNTYITGFAAIKDGGLPYWIANISIASCVNFVGSFSFTELKDLFLVGCTAGPASNNIWVEDCVIRSCRFNLDGEIRVNGEVQLNGALEVLGDAGAGNYKFRLMAGASLNKGFVNTQIYWLVDGTGTLFGLPQPGASLDMFLSQSVFGATVTALLYSKGCPFAVSDVGAPTGTVTGDAYTLEEGAVGQVGVPVAATGDDVVLGAAGATAYASLPATDTTELCRAYT